VCGPGVVKKYLNRISGPLLDRIDLHVEVTPVDYEELMEGKRNGESSNVVRERVVRAHDIQRQRFHSWPTIFCNAQMPGLLVHQYCGLDSAGSSMLKMAMEKLQLSARAYDRILKVARTVADLEGSERIDVGHMAEAIQYRSLDREGWAG